ncbi:MAG TPA: peptidase M15, partial [Cellulomonas sp.]
MHRSAIAAVVAAALVAGGGAAWAWDVRASGAATAQSRDRVASAVAAGQRDEQSAADLSDRSADLVGQGLLGDSAAALSQAIPAAQAVLDASAGKVADDAARQQLASVIALAQAAVDGSAAPARADDLAGQLSSASGAVTAAQQAWEADQAAKAAAAATASARAAAARATPTPVDSCRTTYHGPVFYTSAPSATGTGANGDLPASAMAPVSWAVDSRGVGYWLVKAATASLEKLDVAFRAQFGHDLDIDLAYRDRATQDAMYQALGPSVAATPGTSNHGW